ncbi:phosphonate ABC transporter ATP-binding protein [Paenibacillus alkalitolerans]|uniref:phosphonate ABC transporter ATP-binding protein n=1 Tax=Paenibacillus alkalitolerans TaxID=2799335 RepID=UPI002D7FAECA|nr:phosphonate ABC transporter ATP-binding protein [Paenibacillus alkalitolerans]
MTLLLDQLKVTYGAAGIPALDGVSAAFRPGEMIGILGRSGAGKSTLVRCINGLVRPSGGTIVWNGTDLLKLPPPELRVIRTRIGMVFQSFGLVPRTTVLTNVLLGMLGSRPAWKNAVGYFSREERLKAEEALRSVGLQEYFAQRVERLSGGQQQRVAIARMLVQEPSMLLGDEPVASLDPVTARGIMDVIARIRRERECLTIVNLHDVKLAREYCDRILGLREGRIVFDGRPEDVDASVQRMIYV